MYDVITKEGIIKLCDKCCNYEDSPVIRKPTVFQLKEIERSPGTYERLARMAGINPNEKRTEKIDYMSKQEMNLRAIIDKNYEEKIKHEATRRPDLIDNFHWAIMRARRAKHIMRKQLAEAIGEPEMAIKKAEEGALPENNYLLNKIQSYLGINLFKDENKNTLKNPVPFSIKPSDIKTKSPDNLTIADLKRINEEKTKKDLLDEDIGKLIFKK